MEKPHIVSDPKVMLGKPVIAGTRITVEYILEELGAGRSMSDLVKAHPNLTAEKIQAALTYAASVLKLDVEYPIAG
jgi:uncharacterized protein (DUF433 family)